MKHDYALSYYKTAKGYTGVYALRGEDQWRSCRGVDGELIWHDNYYQAEADAAHRFVAMIRREQSK